MVRNLSAEPLFPTADIQGDILVGLLKKSEKWVFFTITNPVLFADFLRTLEITSMQECLDQRAERRARKQVGDTDLMSTPGLNVAFTSAGLTTLKVKEMPTAGPFVGGMAASKQKLGDPDSGTWKILGKPAANPVHGVFLVAGATEAEVDTTIALRLAKAGDNGWSKVGVETGTVRPDPVAGHEHFGYADGVSQPAVRGRIAPHEALEPTLGDDQNQADPGRDLLWPGEFLFGYPKQNIDGPVLTVKGPVDPLSTSFMDNGAFLVFRRLAQKVPEFDLAVKAAAAKIDSQQFDQASATLLGAQLVGRWKSGAALINAPTADDPTVADGTPLVNAFEFGDDRDGLVCPWGAHIRKAYPRNDVRGNVDPKPGPVAKAESFTQAHRMLRRGIAFGAEIDEAEAMSGQTSEKRGLLFACYVTSIENQFEFVQQSWVNAKDFSQPGAGVDAIIGQNGTKNATLRVRGAAPFSVQTARKPEIDFGRFVEMEGGEYFFAPSIPAIRSM